MDPLEYSRQQRSMPNLPDARVWNRVRARRCGGFKFRRQAIIGKYFADFACYEAKLAVLICIPEPGRFSAA